MAGAAYTTTVPKVLAFSDFLGNFVVKTSEIINNGDLASVDSSGLLVVASKTASGVVIAAGVAIMDQERGIARSVTGDGTKRMSLYKKATIGNLNSTLVPSLTTASLAVLLGPTPTATVSNYTCAISTTNTDEVEPVGTSVDGSTINISVPFAGFMKAQTAGNSTLTQG